MKTTIALMLGRLEKYREALDSIECMAAEGPDAIGCLKALGQILAIIKRARAALAELAALEAKP